MNSLVVIVGGVDGCERKVNYCERGVDCCGGRGIVVGGVWIVPPRGGL